MRPSLLLALAAALLAAWFAPSAPEPEVQPVARQSKPPTAQAPSPGRPVPGTQAGVLSIQARAPVGAVSEAHRLFAGAPPAAPRRLDASAQKATPAIQPSPPPAPRPVAPALPFRVIGRYIENGQVVMMLQHGNDSLLARRGEVLAAQYRVEGLSGTGLVLRYLPLDELQILETAATP